MRIGLLRAQPLGLARPPFRLLVEQCAYRFQHGVVARELPAVGEVEAVVEVSRVPPLGVLEDRLELVERLRELRLWRPRRLVLVPEGSEIGRASCRERV